MRDLISVIVPIYNVEKYIRKCVESILNQTYDNLEIILVDDGSPDSSGQIIEEYSKRDLRIRCFHKENGGLSDARNYGLKYAKGKYVTFIDSDDYIHTNYIEILYDEIKNNNADISICNPIYVYENSNKIIKPYKFKFYKRKVVDSRTALKTMLYQKNFDTSAWGKLYKIKLFENIEYPKGILYEDLATTYKLFLKSQKIVYTNYNLYYYLQRDSSIMGQNFKNKDMDYIYVAEKMCKDIEMLKDTELLDAAICRMINANFSILMKINNDKKHEKYKIQIMNNIKKWRKKVLLNNHVRLKTKMAILIFW